MPTKPKVLDYEQIVNEAAEKLEGRFAEIQSELAPLRAEERDVAEAIHRIVGSYPSGYAAPRAPASAPRASAPSRPRATDEERAAQIVQLIQANPGQHGFKSIADAIGVSPATATKTAKALMESGQIKSEGEKRGLRLFPI
jgi:hypothetical protein